MDESRSADYRRAGSISVDTAGRLESQATNSPARKRTPAFPTRTSAGNVGSVALQRRRVVSDAPDRATAVAQVKRAFSMSAAAVGWLALRGARPVRVRGLVALVLDGGCWRAMTATVGLDQTASNRAYRGDEEARSSGRRPSLAEAIHHARSGDPQFGIPLTSNIT